MRFTLNGKPRTHSKFTGVSDHFTGPARVPRRRSSATVEKRSRAAILGSCPAWLSRPPNLSNQIYSALIFLFWLLAETLEMFIDCVVGVPAVTATLSWSGNTLDRQAGNRKSFSKRKALEMRFTLNGKPRTHSKFTGVSDHFTGPARVPRRRSSATVEKRSRAAILGSCPAWLSRPPDLGNQIYSALIFLFWLLAEKLEMFFDYLVGVPSVTATLSWSGNTLDRQAGNRKSRKVHGLVCG